MRYVTTFMGILAVLGIPAALAADDLPAAMVLEVEGTAPPGLEEFAPIVAGAAYVLPEATTVAFNHLALCRTIRVKGGILIVNAKDFSNLDGEVLSTEKAECPEKIALKSEGVVGGVRLRAFGEKPSAQPATGSLALPVRPVIFLHGKKAASVDRIKVQEGDKVVIELPVTGDQVVWPATAASLAFGKSYLIKFSGKESGRIFQTEVRTKGRDQGGESAVVFLHVE